MVSTKANEIHMFYFIIFMVSNYDIDKDNN